MAAKQPYKIDKRPKNDIEDDISGTRATVTENLVESMQNEPVVADGINFENFKNIDKKDKDYVFGYLKRM